VSLPGARPVRLVCLDVDGTLVGSDGRVPDAVWPAAERLRAAGVRLAVCTGRAGFGHARAWAERLDAGGWHVFQNGASVVHLATGASRSRPLGEAVTRRLVALARRTGRVLELYGDTAYAVARDTPEARAHAVLLGTPWAPRPLDTFEQPVVRALWVVPSDDLAALLADAPHDGCTVGIAGTPSLPHMEFVNVTAAGADKAAAVRAVAASYDVALDEVMMVGDGAVDVGPMRIVGHAVAMGNAEPEVRAVAGTVVGHVDDHGLVEALALVGA
jgi:Cof subfamily protein (haloacid dehalogenase superfamily)